MSNFDRVAVTYRALEYLAFGRALEEARFHYLDRLRDSRRVLILGEGDGRFLERLVVIAPQASIRCLDSSAAMLARAADRLPPAARARVTFECADIRTAAVPPAAYDTIVTMFVLDCLTPGEVTALVRRLATGLQDDGQWLFADFVLPASGWRRLRARLWISGLYAFFRWRTGLAVRELPPSGETLQAEGFRVVDRATWQHGLLTAALYARRGERS